VSARRKAALVLGGTSQIGHFLLPMLRQSGFEVQATSRSIPSNASDAARWIELDLAQGLSTGALPAPVDYVVSFVPLAVLPPSIADLAALGVRRILAFSSTSVFSKIDSPDLAERTLVARLGQAEDNLSRLCVQYGIAWTVFRPTLIYCPGLDRNVSEIARFVQRFGVFPIVGPAQGRRQPVHAADLAAACMAALDNSKTYNKAYNLSGGQTLTYREMVEEVFRALGKRPRVVRVPLWLIKLAISVASFYPRFRSLSPELATRMNQDLCFDFSEARRDFGFAPRAFRFEESKAV